MLKLLQTKLSSLFQQGEMIKPNFNSVDLSEVELPSTGETVEDVYAEELPVYICI